MWYVSVRLAETTLGNESDVDVSPLVSQLRDGHAEAIVMVYRQYQDSVRNFGRRLLGSDADAEELVQDTFVQLPRAMRNFRGEASLKTFILGITAQLSRNYLRSRRRRKALLERAALNEEVYQSTQGDEAERNFWADRLSLAMEQLSADQRLAFVLLEVEERTSSEVSQILNVPASTLRARAGAARAKLKELLSEVSHER
jgi:RNA polymerase sigma factor (sigma-70 family)